MEQERRRLTLYIVVLAIIIGIIAGANYYYLKPKVLLTMPSVERVKLPEKTKIPFKSNIYAETLEQILSQKKEQDLIPATLMVKRNPFIWPEEFIKQPPPRTAKEIKMISPGQEYPEIIIPPEMEVPQSFEELVVEEFNLSMVIVGEGGNLALVNGHFLKEGNRIAGYDVVKIEPGTILLANKDEQKVLTMEPGLPLQANRKSAKKPAKKNISKKQAPTAADTSPIDFQTQLKQVMQLYSDPNLLLK